MTSAVAPTVIQPPRISGSRKSTLCMYGGVKFGNLSMSSQTPSTNAGLTRCLSEGKPNPVVEAEQKPNLVVEAEQKPNLVEAEQKPYVVVTHASHGYGRAIALAAAQRGYHLFIHSHPKDLASLANVEKEIREMGCSVYTWCHDFSKDSDAHAHAPTLIQDISKDSDAHAHAPTLIQDTVLKVFPKVDVVIFTQVIPAEKHMSALCDYTLEVAWASTRQGYVPRIVSVCSLLPEDYVREAVGHLADMCVGWVDLNAVIVPPVEFRIPAACVGAVLHYGFSEEAQNTTGEVAGFQIKQAEE